MKYATAVRQLVTIAEEATATAGALRSLSDRDVLGELWTGGKLLDGPDELKTAEVVVVLHEPVDELPWQAFHAAGEWVADRLHLTKLPISWYLRPIGYPAWNPLMRRVLRFWSARGGLDQDVMECLRQRRLAALPVVRPSAAELSAQLTIELAQCQRRLRQTLDAYWQPSWRRGVNASGGQPDDYLWRAAEAVCEIEDGLAELGVEVLPPA